MTKHGGKRPGAGRKPAPAGTTKIPYSTKLSPEVIAILRKSGNAARAIEDAVKQWWEQRKQGEN